MHFSLKLRYMRPRVCRPPLKLKKSGRGVVDYMKMIMKLIIMMMMMLMR